MAINAPYLAQEAGFPGQWSDEINPVPEGLIVGETPAVVTQDMALAADQTILAYTPVMFDASDNLVPATAGTPAVGITLYDIVTPAGTPLVGVPILRQGCLNRDMLNWGEDYTTDALKLNAFEGASSPTSIVVRIAYRGSVVANP